MIRKDPIQFAAWAPDTVLGLVRELSEHKRRQDPEAGTYRRRVHAVTKHRPESVTAVTSLAYPEPTYQPQLGSGRGSRGRARKTYI